MVILTQGAGSETASFSERLLLAAVGPAVTAVLGGLLVWFITTTVQARRDERVRERDLARAKAEHDLAVQARDDALRQDLVGGLTQAASALYLAGQHYWRAVKQSDQGQDDVRRQELRDRLDAQYLSSRLEGEVLEKRLEGYFSSAATSDAWHKVMDLLTVRYFQLIDRTSVRLYERNSNGYKGREHSGLTVQDLSTPASVLDAYQTALSEAVRCVFEHPLRARSGSAESPRL